MSGEHDWLDYVQKLGPAMGAIASAFAAMVAVRVASRSSSQLLKEQAQKITAWLDNEEPNKETGAGDPQYLVRLSNASQQSAYDIVVRVVRVPNRPNFEALPKLAEADIVDTKYILTLPPGQRTVDVMTPSSGMHRRFGVEFAFQDAAGTFWYRNSVGVLSKIPKHPVDYFGLSWPVGWGS